MPRTESSQTTTRLNQNGVDMQSQHATHLRQYHGLITNRMIFMVTLLTPDAALQTKMPWSHFGGK